MFRKLEQIFNQLPPITIGGKDYKPMFRYGTEERLAADLSLRRKRPDIIKYPLIYLETPIVISDEVELRFILATINKRTDMTNSDRLNWTYDPVLYPLRDNVIKSLLRSGLFKRTPETPGKMYKGEHIFNYHMTPDIWDALIYTTHLKYDDNCEIRKIYF